MEQENHIHFADQWLKAWNSHDVEAILAHYSEELEFTSPIMIQMGINRDGTITNKTVLQNYFEQALKNYPGLKFELQYVVSGVQSLVICYKSVRDLFAAEYMELDAAGKVTRVKAHYATGK